MLTPKELDDQCKIKIDKWIDLYSEECRELDSDYQLTLKWFKILQGETLFTDRDGRLWGRGKDGYLYPFHFEYGKKLIGYRISARAAN
jgi:hypothetical protein